MLLEAFLTSLFISTFCYPVLDCRHEPLGVSGTLFFCVGPSKKTTRLKYLRRLCPLACLLPCWAANMHLCLDPFLAWALKKNGSNEEGEQRTPLS